MPGFLSSSIALSVFKVAENKHIENITEAKLKQYCFTPIKNNDDLERSYGWVSIENMLDTKFLAPSEYAEFICFSLRVDTRKVPSSVLKKHVQEAFQAELESSGKESISRERKKEIKELHKSKLLSKIEPAPAITDIAVDTTNGYVYISTTSKSTLELIQEHLKLSFNVELTPIANMEDVSEVIKLLHLIYDVYQNVTFNNQNYSVASNLNSVSLVNSDGSGSQISAKNEPCAIKASLGEGLSIVKLSIDIENTSSAEKWSFVMNSDYTFSGLKTPTIAPSADDDQEAELLEKLYLVSQAVGVMNTLFASVKA